MGWPLLQAADSQEQIRAQAGKQAAMISPRVSLAKNKKQYGCKFPFDFMNITFLLEYTCTLPATPLLFSCKQDNSILCSDMSCVHNPCRLSSCSGEKYVSYFIHFGDPNLIFVFFFFLPHLSLSPLVCPFLLHCRKLIIWVDRPPPLWALQVRQISALLCKQGLSLFTSKSAHHTVISALL